MEKEILITNDDGVNAKGIKEVAEFMRIYGNVTVVAPKDPQSAKSASLTMDKIMRLEKIKEEDQNVLLHKIRVYSFSGTPADCVKMGVNMYKEEGTMPDLLVSGINHGSNASSAAVYSGTLGAAKEGTIYDIPSIGLSIRTHNMNADFTAVKHFTKIIIDMYLNNPPSKGVYLNVNFPNLPVEEIKGIVMAHQGKGRWIKEYEKRTDPHAVDYYWMTGTFTNLEPDGAKGDHQLNEEGYITIVPHSIDTTDYKELDRLKNIWSLPVG